MIIIIKDTSNNENNNDHNNDKIDNKQNTTNVIYKQM